METAQTYQKLQEENALQQVQMAQMAEQIAVLKQQLDWFKRQLFGRKSEKQIEDNPYQYNLFEADKPPASPEPTTEVKAHKRKNTTERSGDEVNDTGLRFDASVPTKVIELSAPELEGEDAEQYEVIDYKETTRLAQQPGSYTVLIYRRPVVRRKKDQSITCVAAPGNVLESCYADVSVLAGIMVDKAVYHLPLYRQHQRMLDTGIHISRSTLTNWIKKGIELLKPIYQAQWRHILQSNVLAMDEVPIKAGRKKKGKMKQTYYWPIYGEDNEVAFTWSPTKSHRHAVEQLTGFSGTLLTDGYAAYNSAINKLNANDSAIIHANCWAHGRRKIEHALDMEPEAARQGLAIIAALYKHEKVIRESEWAADEILAYRQKHSEPLVNEFFTWIYEQRQREDLLPSERLSTALLYLSQREAELKVFLANPHVAIDTNHLERALRVIPMGRKNFMFCWTELGAEHLGILQSLMVTCRLHKINPYTYLVDVLQRVSMHPASQVEDLTPRAWKDKFADNFLTSDLQDKG
jgi:transposase